MRMGWHRGWASVWRSLVMLLALVWLSPLLWMGVTAFKARAEVFDPQAGFWPAHWNWSNFSSAWAVAPFDVYLLNSLISTGGILAAQLLTVVLAAYAFAQLRFRGKNVLFGLFLLQIMFPIYATFLTNFLTVRSLGLFDHVLALIVPFAASGYGTFLLRQAFRQIPLELIEAARLDGCGHLGILWHVCLPLTRPALLAFGIISVVTHWNDYIWPLLATNSDHERTLPIGLGLLAKADSGADWTRLMAATLMVIAPLLCVFFVFQRRFVNSFMHAGLK